MSVLNLNPIGQRMQGGKPFQSEAVISVLPLACGLLATLTGTLGLYGWHTQTDVLIQPLPNTSPFLYNTALAMVALGLALVLTVLARERAAITLSALVLVFAGAHSFEYTAGINLGIDQLFMQDYLRPLDPYPGRMGLDTAGGFELSALALLCLNLQRLPRARFIAAIAGAIVFAHSLSMLVLFFSGMGRFYLNEDFFRISFPIAGAFVFLGLGIMAVCPKSETGATERSPGWIPYAVAVFIGIVFTNLAFTIHLGNAGMLEQKSRSSLMKLWGDIRSQVQFYADVIHFMSRREETYGQVTEQAWFKDAVFHNNHCLPLRAILWLDSAGAAQRIVPSPGGEFRTEQDFSASAHWGAALENASRTGEDVVLVSESGEDLEVIAPALSNGTLAGYNLGVINFKRTFDKIFREIPPVNMPKIELFFGGKMAYQSYGEEGEVPFIEQTGVYRGLPVKLRYWPREDLQSQSFHRVIPWLVFISGGFLAVFSALWLRRAGDLKEALEKEKEVEQALRESEANLVQAQAIAHIGNWVWDVPSGCMQWSEEMYRIAGQNPAKFVPTYANAMSTVHPDDYAFVETSVQKAFQDGTSFDIEFRVIREDGDIRFVHNQGKVYCDGDGRASKFIGTLLDITERKQKTDAVLHRSEERFSRVFEQSVVGIVFTSLDGRLEKVNSGFARMLGYEVAELEGRTIDEITHPADRETTRYNQRQLIEGGSPVESLEKRYLAKNGNVVWGKVFPAVVRDAGGKPLYFVAVIGDISTEKAALEEWFTAVKTAKEARETAEKASRVKSEFLSRMSHELRTPLNAINGFAQILLMDRQEGLSARQKEGLENILTSGEHLLNLIDDVLDFTRYDAHKQAQFLRPVLLFPLVNEVAVQLHGLAARNEVTIENKLGADEPRIVLADETRLRQVLLNLVSNGIKYNRPGGRVTVSAAPLPEGRIAVKVADTGIGIPVSQKEKVFSPFERLGHEKSNILGTGLGLTICKRLVEDMGGDIRFDSMEGQGTRFFVKLPAVEHAPAEDKPKEQDFILDPSLSEMVVLYVEDNPGNLGFIKMLFSMQSNMKLLATRIPGEGLQLAEAYRPHLVLLDIQLPEMDGFEVLRHLQNNPKTRNIPVVAISADVYPETIERARNAGFRDYLTKPIDIHRLLQTVADHSPKMNIEPGAKPKAEKE